MGCEGSGSAMVGAIVWRSDIVIMDAEEDITLSEDEALASIAALRRLKYSGLRWKKNFIVLRNLFCAFVSSSSEEPYIVSSGGIARSPSRCADEEDGAPDKVDPAAFGFGAGTEAA